MPWNTSQRKAFLPHNWEALRLRVLQRDHYQCQAKDAHGRKCLRPANQCDHITPGNNHSMDNLQALCASCHAKKSSAEGAAGRAASAARAPARRPTEEHPLDRLKRCAPL